MMMLSVINFLSYIILPNDPHTDPSHEQEHEQYELANRGEPEHLADFNPVLPELEREVNHEVLEEVDEAGLELRGDQHYLGIPN